ncbi:MAG: DoxX family protein, partial [Sphingobacterium sp.]
MNLIQRIEHWGDTHHPRWVDVVRIALGVLIFAKGVSFIMDRESVAVLIEQTHFQLSIWSAVHYVVFAHLVGGIFIALGFSTRLA